MEMAEKRKQDTRIERLRRDIFGVANEIYVANTRKLKAFLRVLEEFIPSHRSEWKNTKIPTKWHQKSLWAEISFSFFLSATFTTAFISSSTVTCVRHPLGDFNQVAPSNCWPYTRIIHSRFKLSLGQSKLSDFISARPSCCYEYASKNIQGQRKVANGPIPIKRKGCRWLKRRVALLGNCQAILICVATQPSRHPRQLSDFLVNPRQ